jgi:putative protease
MATIEQRNYFSKGDMVEIFGPNIDPITITINEIYNEKNELIDVVRHPRQIVKIKVKERLLPYYLIRKKGFDKKIKV